MTPVCSSGMRTLNRKSSFRPWNNSPFPRHLTLKALLCFYSTIIHDVFFKCKTLREKFHF